MNITLTPRQLAVLDFFKTVAIALAIILPIRFFIAQPFYVRGSSMEPNFHDFEYLFTEEVSYYFHAPVRGDVVVLKNPQDESEYFIKRIIGIPGEHVEVREKTVYINDVQLDESAYLAEDVDTWGSVDVTLGADQYFVMGDNRGVSLDSRVFGPLNRTEIVGRAWIRIFPFSRIAHFSEINYPSN
ncbi:MAG: signal peptidase I [Candidatus Kerfeldbacteria bacterium]|nr:signal peptidase I [Candidatus Kerfeldbacteria bacterium]